jgi:hypothetical protein
MKSFSMKGRLPLMLGLGGVVVSVAAVGAFFRRLIPHLLIALLVVGVIWIAAHFVMLLWRRRRQHSFDAGVAAKEGIDDRRREWASWTEELNRQGIDRYELPFYLLVGEPQSGKSVLLQNSELHFPFGQTRLSGVGGTRGCDWWFTEEAVILDLAGRLFTHEGGASDALEWGAFLELLSEFRPLCPANGVMLVIPCDSLLLDSREEATRKASRMQEAMLTLTGKLQAQLPIYVILTKGDRVFGFAETVHRLDAERRQQMFGWSRRAEDFEQPFDMVEVREAFGGMVERARLLRETMLSTLRLPEGLPEADRVYALPDELEALMPNLEVYLKRIFSESTLVDRLYFRGFYLTSGLQVGAPIAKVCSKLLGGEGDADKRNLEALFSKQQAYFIKDLVRRRVFSERGLVRPTKKRVARAQKSAWIGYGTAALIALVSTVWSAFYVIKGYQGSELSAFERALELGRDVAQEPEPEPAAVLAAMEAAWQAKEVETNVIEELGESRQESFEQLFQRLADKRLVPSLRREAERRLRSRVESPASQPQDAEQFLGRVEQALVLLADWHPLGSEQPSAEGTHAGPEEAHDLLAVLEDPKLTTSAAALLAHRKKSIEVPAPTSASVRSGALAAGDLGQAVAWLDGQWSRLLTFGDDLQVDGQLGCLVAWQAGTRAHAELTALTADVIEPGQVKSFHDAMARLQDTAAYLRASNVAGKALEHDKLLVELNELASRRARLMAESGRAAPEVQGAWSAHEQLLQFLQERLGPSSAASGEAEGPASRPAVGESLIADALVFEVCRDGFLPQVVAAPAGIADVVEQARARVDSAAQAKTSAADLALARGVLGAKVRALAAEYRRAYPDSSSLVGAIVGAGQAVTSRPALLVTLTHLGALDGCLRAMQSPEVVEPWRSHLKVLAGETLTGLEAVATHDNETSVEASFLSKLDAFHEAFDDEALRRRVSSLEQDHARGVSQRVLERLRAIQPSGKETVRLLVEADAFLKSVEAPPNSAATARLLSQSELEEWSTACEALVRKHLEHHEENVRARCKDNQPTMVGASPLAADIQDRISVSALLAVQTAFDLPDLEQPEIGAARLAFGSRAYAKRIADSLDEFQARWRRVTQLDENKRREALSILTEALSLKPRQMPLTGREVAAAFKAHLGRREDVAKQGIGSALDYYLETLTDNLDGQCRSTLMDLYVADLTVLMEKRRWLRETLYLTAAELTSKVDLHRPLAADLAKLFDPDGEFDRLQEDYQQTGEPKVEFRPEAGTATGPMRSWWAFDEFLRELRFFVQGPDTKVELEACTVDIWLEQGDDRTGVWSRPNLFTNFEPGPDGYVNTRTKTRVGQLKWGFAENSGHEIRMRWSDAMLPRSDDIEVSVKSCFAPLSLCWQSENRMDDGKRWGISADTVKPAAEGARFVLEFNRPLPARPAQPW